MNIRRPGRYVVLIWCFFVAVLLVGLSLLAIGAPGGPILVIIGGIGNVAAGWYVFATTPADPALNDSQQPYQPDQPKIAA